MLIEPVKKNSIKYSFQVHDFPEIIDYANQNLKTTGLLQCDEKTNYSFLKISDDYIHKTFPMLQNKIQDNTVTIPDYFNSQKNAGAHISLVYANEPNARLVRQYIETIQNGKPLNFKVNELVSIRVFNKLLYVLTVACPELDKIRKKFNLTEKLNYHGLLVPFHITIARG